MTDEAKESALTGGGGLRLSATASFRVGGPRLIRLKPSGTAFRIFVLLTRLLAFTQLFQITRRRVCQFTYCRGSPAVAAGDASQSSQQYDRISTHAHGNICFLRQQHDPCAVWRANLWRQEVSTFV